MRLTPEQEAIAREAADDLRTDSPFHWSDEHQEHRVIPAFSDAIARAVQVQSKDTARLDWLEKMRIDCRMDEDNEQDYDLYFGWKSPPASLREAIDAARSE